MHSSSIRNADFASQKEEKEMLIFSKQKDLLIFPVKRSKKYSFNNFRVNLKKQF